MSGASLVVDRIGLLVTNDPSLGEGPLGVVRDASLVVEDGRVVAEFSKDSITFDACEQYL